MTNIFLTGKLGATFGKHWRLDVSSPAEAIRAINANTKGKFLEYLEKNKNKYYKVALQKKDNLVGSEEIKNKSGNSNIYIMPTIQGSGAAGKIILGAVLIVVGVVYQQPWLWQMGAAMVLGGIVELMTKTPNFDDYSGSNEDGRQSTLFQGNASTIFQGGAVGLVYGRALVAPMPISLSINNSDSDITASINIGSVEQRDLGGGGYEYQPGVSQQY